MSPLDPSLLPREACQGPGGAGPSVWRDIPLEILSPLWICLFGGRACGRQLSQENGYLYQCQRIWRIRENQLPRPESTPCTLGTGRLREKIEGVWSPLDHCLANLEQTPRFLLLTLKTPNILGTEGERLFAHSSICHVHLKTVMFVFNQWVWSFPQRVS